MAPRANTLGDYLRARRQQLSPDDVGLVAGRRRRVAGLRREEVATLAGISSAYYLRLEQGRDTRPSGQVVEALARALRLDLKAAKYLHRLASATGSSRPQPVGDTVADTLRQLIDQLPVPVAVGNRYLDVLAANPCARALCPGLAPGENVLCWLFLDPAARILFGYHPGAVHMRHEQVGDLHLYRTRLRVPHSDGQHLLIYHAEPGSDSAAALEALGSVSNSRSTK